MKRCFGLFPVEEKPKSTELNFVETKELITDIEQAKMKDFRTRAWSATRYNAVSSCQTFIPVPLTLNVGFDEEIIIEK